MRPELVRSFPDCLRDPARADNARLPTMMVLAAVIFMHVLVSLSVYLYVFGVFNTSYLRIFQVAFYLLLIGFALTLGVGIEHVLRYLRPTGHTLAAVE